MLLWWNFLVRKTFFLITIVKWVNKTPFRMFDVVSCFVQTTVFEYIGFVCPHALMRGKCIVRLSISIANVECAANFSRWKVNFQNNIHQKHILYSQREQRTTISLRIIAVRQAKMSVLIVGFSTHTSDKVERGLVNIHLEAYGKYRPHDWKANRTNYGAYSVWLRSEEWSPFFIKIVIKFSSNPRPTSVY